MHTRTRRIPVLPIFALAVLSTIFLAACFDTSTELPDDEKHNSDGASNRSGHLVAITNELIAFGIYSADATILIEAELAHTQDLDEIAILEITLARLYSHLGDRDLSRKHAEAAYSAANLSEDIGLRLDAMLSVAIAETSADPNGAREMATLAGVQAVESGLIEQVVQSHWILGLIEEDSGKKEQALHHYELAQSIGLDNNIESEGLVQAIFHSGHMLDQLGNHREAIDKYRLAEQSAIEFEIPRLIPFAPYHIARIRHEEFRDAPAALDSLERAKGTMRILGLSEFFLLPIAWQRIGDINCELMNLPADALDSYKNAAQIARAAGHEQFVQRSIEANLPKAEEVCSK